MSMTYFTGSVEHQIVEELHAFLSKDAGATVAVHVNEADSSLKMIYMQSSIMKEYCARWVTNVQWCCPPDYPWSG